MTKISNLTLLTEWYWNWNLLIFGINMLIFLKTLFLSYSQCLLTVRKRCPICVSMHWVCMHLINSCLVGSSAEYPYVFNKLCWQWGNCFAVMDEKDWRNYGILFFTRDDSSSKISVEQQLEFWYFIQYHSSYCIRELRNKQFLLGLDHVATIAILYSVPSCFL